MARESTDTVAAPTAATTRGGEVDAAEHGYFALLQRSEEGADQGIDLEKGRGRLKGRT